MANMFRGRTVHWIATFFFLTLPHTARAVAVSWVPNADGLWQTATNWTSSPSLPGATDDVTIDRPALITVTLSSGDQSIRSLVSQENLIIGNGTALTLTVGAGGGTTNGALTISPGALLRVTDGGVFQANGTTTITDAGLLAELGGKITLPSTNYTANLTFNPLLRAFSGGNLNLSAVTTFTTGSNGSWVVANGAGSVVNLSSVTTFSPGTYYNSRVYAQEGGTVNLSAVASITTGAVDVIASGANSKVNLTNLSTFSSTNFDDTRRLRAENGGQIIAPNITSITGRASIELSGATSQLDISHITSANDLSFLSENGATLALPAPTTSYSGNLQFYPQFRANSGGTFNASSLTTYTVGANGSWIVANGAGSVVNLSNVTTFSPGTYYNSKVFAQDGGTVNLSAVTSIATGAVDVIASGTNSKVNLTSLTTFSPTNFDDTRRLRAENGGQIIAPNLTSITCRASIELSGATSQLDISHITSATDLNFLSENGATLTLPPALTSYTASAAFIPTFRAYSGGTLNATSLTTYTVGANGSQIVANGAGSVVNMSGLTTMSPGTYYNTDVYAQDGGTVNLSGIASITTGAADVIANGTNSKITLSNLATFNSTNFDDPHRLRAENNGVVQLKTSGTTTVTNSTVETDPTGTISGNTLQISTGATLSGNGVINANYAPNAAGTTKFIISGLTVDSQYDQMEVTGNAALNGTLQVALTGGFVPVFGQSFDILKVDGTISGAFSNLNLAMLTGGLQWKLVTTAHMLTLQVVNFYGDYNGNGLVDSGDYVIWRKMQGYAGINLAADGDHNGIVNQLDYDLWRSKFAQNSGSGAGLDTNLTMVPEPACALLLLLSASTLSCRLCLRRTHRILD